MLSTEFNVLKRNIRVGITLNFNTILRYFCSEKVSVTFYDFIKF